jgi:hypothetical protein
MSNASQRDCTGETGNATTNNDEADLEGCLLCGFMTTRLGTIWEVRSAREGGEEKERRYTG